MKLLALILLQAYVQAQNYILVPKPEVLSSPSYSFVDVQIVAEEYNLEDLAAFSFDDASILPFYITTHENVMKYKNTLSRMYDIEEDITVSISDNDQFTFTLVGNKEVPWHLSRVSQRELPLKNAFPYGSRGSCHKSEASVIDTYIIDTGIDIEHPQFEGRAVWGANFADETDTDCNNHGTHVAGLVGSKDYGVCVDANLHAVKVLSCEGSGSLSGVIRGIEWAFNSHVKKSNSESSTVKSIINMSLGGGFSKAINRAVEVCVEKDDNFYVVVAAGNENQDACDTSPGSVMSIITVMASDIHDNRASFSNWGRCANIYAPGVDIVSTIPDGQIAKYSGTSMASPVMAGVLNHYVDQYPGKSLKEMMKLLKKVSTKDVVKHNEEDTSNLLAFLQR
jgi:hypothetical protein